MNAQTLEAATLEAATLEALRDLDGEAEGFSVLGVGANTAKLTLEAHRAVDVALNEAFAKALKSSGKVRHFGLMTAVGDDPNAKSTMRRQECRGLRARVSNRVPLC